MTDAEQQTADTTTIVTLSYDLTATVRSAAFSRLNNWEARDTMDHRRRQALESAFDRLTTQIRAGNDPATMALTTAQISLLIEALEHEFRRADEQARRAYAEQCDDARDILDDARR